MKTGDLITGIDRSFERSIYKLLSEPNVAGEATMSCEGFGGHMFMEYPEEQRSYERPLAEFRLATQEEIRAACFTNSVRLMFALSEGA